jgi:hypothetical protein
VNKSSSKSVHARMAALKKKLKTVEDVLEAYAAGDDLTRAALRKLFAEKNVYHWASGEPPPRTTAEGFRQHLLLISVIDQWPDFRDTLLYLRDVYDEALAAGVDVRPVLREVGKLSSDESSTAMGSLKSLLLGMSRRPR